MRITAIVNRKGGVGKTATVHALGAGLIRQGKKVLYIDLDSQGNLSYTLQAKEGMTILEALTKTADINDIIQTTEQGDIIPANQSLAVLDTLITDFGKEYRLQEAINNLKEPYDYVLIDTSAQLGLATFNALVSATDIIIPVQADIYSLQAIGLLNEVIHDVKKYANPDLQINGILLTRHNKRALLSQEINSRLESLSHDLNTRVYKTPIRECISIKEAQALKVDIFSYAPKSNAVLDYNDLIAEYLE